MTRRALLLLPLLLPRRTEAAGFHITGWLGGTDAEGGYFELVNEEDKGQGELILATPIRSPLYPHLTALVGTRVQVSVFNP